MDKIELYVNGKPLIFTSKSVTYAGHEFFYSKMSNITHRGGSQPAYLFNYEGKRIALPDDPKNKKITLKIFQQVAAMEKNRTAAISPYLPKEEPVTPVDELHYKPYWLIAVAIIIVVLALLAVFVRSGIGDDSKSVDGSNSSVKSTSSIAGSTISQSNSKKAKKISMSNNEGTLIYTKSQKTTNYDGQPAVMVFFEYTNRRNDAGTISDTFYTQVFQNGVECESTMPADDNIKEIDNSLKDVQKETTIEIAFIFTLQDSRNPITLKVSDYSNENLFDNIYQEQKITLK